VRAAFDGLLVDPCIPSAWDGFKVRRTFRGATYNIEVTNPDHVQCGVKEMWVDGQRHCESKGTRDKVVPQFAAGTTHEVVVVLGSGST
jgi:cellobiose phosphorylase